LIKLKEPWAGDLSSVHGLSQELLMGALPPYVSSSSLCLL